MGHTSVLSSIIAGLVTAFFIAGTLANAMTSTNFSINWDSVNSGGHDVSTSTNFRMRDTIGEQGIGISTSTNFEIDAGYRFGDSEATVLSFEIGTQENSTQTSYSSFNNGGLTVVVSSAASFSVGDFIGVVEDEGLSQIIAIGKITSIVGTTLTIDQWDGSPGSLSASPSGGNDFVYRLGGGAAQLGTLSTSAGATSLTRTSVITNAPRGYTVYVSADGKLRVNSSQFIADVADGTVTIGSEEYGARVFGSTATSTGSDFAFATSTRAIQERTTFGSDRIGLIYKAAISASTAAGSYSQQVYYTITANY